MEDKQLIILNGGIEIEVTNLASEKETVKVRQLPLRKLGDYGLKQGDEGALIELFCDRPQGWADSLTLESQEEIVTTGDAINLPSFTRWTERRLKNGEQLRPLTDRLSASVKLLPGSLPGESSAVPKS